MPRGNRPRPNCLLRARRPRITKRRHRHPHRSLCRRLPRFRRRPLRFLFLTVRLRRDRRKGPRLKLTAMISAVTRVATSMLRRLRSRVPDRAAVDRASRRVLAATAVTGTPVAAVADAASGKAVTLGNAINGSADATVLDRGSPAAQAAVDSAGVVVGRRPPIHRSHYRRARRRFLGICRIPPDLPMSPPSILWRPKFRRGEASRWCWTISTR